MKTIVFDDDPTGSQTVCNCPLLLNWEKSNLEKAISSNSLVFILANTRSLTAELAGNRITQICQSLKLVLTRNSISLDDIFIVSRGDSTLRGHAFLEPEIINQELGPFDATFHIPAFFEGGRKTINSIHYLDDIPMHKTIFAKDSTFGYSTSFLPDWIAEKSKGLINPDEIISITIDQLNKARESDSGMINFIEELSRLRFNQKVIVDAESSIDLDTLCNAIKLLKGKKRFLFRSAASLINSLTNIRTNHNHIKDYSSLIIKYKDKKPKPGLILIGSYIPLANNQLQALLKTDYFMEVELPVKKIFGILNNKNSEDSLFILEDKLINKILDIIELKKTPILYTSRGELTFKSDSSRMKFAISLAESMARITSHLFDRIGYIISKGGITTNTLLTNGLKIEYVILKGQIMPGLSLVCPPQTFQYPPIPIITFPGNLGDKSTLFKAWKIMQSFS